jgi:hypothetical protein
MSRRQNYSKQVDVDKVGKGEMAVGELSWGPLKCI